MLAAFLIDTQWLTFGGFSGRVIRSRFHTVHYHDALFSQAEIPFPPHLTPSVPKRRAEYLAGRIVARQALASLGHPGFIVQRGEDRAPIWPTGVAGALSHNADTVLCAVQHTTQAGGVGLDVETIMAEERAAQLWEAIVTADEYVWLQQQSGAFNLLLTLAFSAKESLFKALYPQVQRYFDFLDARAIAIDWQAQTFELELLNALTADCPAGRRFRGQFLRDGDNVTTIIHL
ncbi:4'-phosphopantetheinyl transferase [Serratia sp. NPDC078593]|uniref:4'-phosphopantetheinyl transferase family protein n=1 Tax=unclassified Serratia (in: enterobacteria) TaxID=2647522 RepID=UPI0037D7D925